MITLKTLNEGINNTAIQQNEARMDKPEEHWNGFDPAIVVFRNLIISLSFSKFIFVVCSVCYNALETLFSVILSFTSNFSSSIANTYKAVGIINNLN